MQCVLHVYTNNSLSGPCTLLCNIVTKWLPQRWLPRDCHMHSEGEAWKPLCAVRPGDPMAPHGMEEAGPGISIALHREGGS